MSKSRKEIEHKQRRHYILECAEKLFAEKGFDGVTVADIAKASEFSVGSLYLFFESKEALIQSLLLERLRQVLDIVEGELQKEIPATQKLENTVERLTTMFMEHIDYFKVHVREVRGPELCQSKQLSAEFRKMFNRIFDLLEAIFTQGIEEGAFREDIEPRYMAHFIDAGMHSLVHFVLHSGDEQAVNEVRMGMQKILYHGILKSTEGAAE